MSTSASRSNASGNGATITERSYFDRQREALAGEIAIVCRPGVSRNITLLKYEPELGAGATEYEQAEQISGGRNSRRLSCDMKPMIP